MGYTVVRTDLLSGTDVAADLVSVRVYDSDDNPIAVENGSIVEVKGYEDGQREVLKGVLASSESDISKCVLIATPEVMYDERKKNLDEFVNEVGSICRGYVLRSRNIFSITEPGFVDSVVPEVDAEVGLGADGKIDGSGTGFGELLAIEVAGRYTYYVIRLK